MWIRSQNKIILLKAKEIRIETEKVKKYIDESELLNYKSEDVYIDTLFDEMHIPSLKTEYRYYVYQSIGYIVVNDKRIARYSTEEKALEVLDRLVGYNEDSIWRLNKIVFQLPRDEEV